MSDIVRNRYEFVLLFDVKNGNPNGDPDAGNLPRIDPETSRGIVTDVCLKRKIRNYVELIKKNQPPYHIYVKEKAILTEQRRPAYESVDEDKKSDKISKARAWMCKNFFDVRAFGAVMSAKENNCGQVRGPVQLSFAESVDPVIPLEMTITRIAVETTKEAETQEGDNRTMGRKSYIPYGLYRSHGFISAPLAGQTGFNEEDLQLLWDALVNMFDHDHSAARGEMATRKLVIFKHSSEIGNAPAHKLFELVQIRRKIDPEKPVREFTDYEVLIDRENVPAGVTIKVWPEENLF
ncbi:MAG: type I-C CRISPR-associated protein Cas7/Csd2 [Deltaproteobacteria bacterium]|nr:type I-C CRISPR-associated protein Cas7/Csd2 [Deltaproteobacteria bacterium]MBW2075398.1 type I-C CRISPR-associated protein Cas7/Csd2 [Deltaproteobacteria bacterium]